MIETVVIDTPSLGDRSYLVTDGTAALVVDPQRDIDRILVAAADRGVAVTHVFETHIHNDYVSGGLALAGETGAVYHVNGTDDVALRRTAIGDGDVIEAGAMRVRVMATPGHTWSHLAYVVTDAEPGTWPASSPAARCCTGSTGRPDLLGARHAPALAAAQHASACRLAVPLPGAHAGLPDARLRQSSARPRPRAWGTGAGLDDRRGGAGEPGADYGRDRYVASAAGRPGCVPRVLHKDGPVEHARRGRARPAAATARAARPGAGAGRGRGLGGGPAGPPRVRGRARARFAQLPARWCVRHEPGLAAARRCRADPARQRPGPGRGRAAGTGQDRRGPDRLRRHRHPGGLAGRRGSRPRSRCPGSTAWPPPGAGGGITILDVRRPLEWAASHIDGAVHIPLHELPGRLGELPAAGPARPRLVWGTARAGTGPAWPPPCWPPRGTWSPSWTTTTAGRPGQDCRSPAAPPPPRPPPKARSPAPGCCSRRRPPGRRCRPPPRCPWAGEAGRGSRAPITGELRRTGARDRVDVPGGHGLPVERPGAFRPPPGPCRCRRR